MKVILVTLVMLGALVETPGRPVRTHATAAAQAPALQDTLVGLEREAWAAWQRRDGSVYDRLLSDDHLDLGGSGRSSKAEVVAFVGSAACTVTSHTIGRFALTRLTEDVALLTYYAQQQTVCGRSPVPSPAWVSSLYVRRNGRWQNVLFQQTAAGT